ncbi:MAG: transcriptional regulator [Spirochaetaceae bacterium 4572_59]|nr:MAG: transcriptional regulator [Spirochaetaceae bacterium 4572_59]
MKFNILVVDDEKNIRMGLGKALELDGYTIFLAEDGNEAMKIMVKTDIDLVVTDLRMPKLSGEELLKKVSSAYPTVPVIILTGHGTVENAVNAMRDGAYDFLTKPLNLDRLSLLVKRALSSRELVLKHRELQAEVARLESKKESSNFIGKSVQMQKVFELISQVASTKASVLITGESGVGKEMVAEALHKQSNRKDNSLVKVHCAALTESLLESELFGHEKGAFTGAVTQRKGRFELSDKGSIFLDEIGEINQSIQIKILRVLQEREFERVGGMNTVKIDTRLITATNRDLKKEIADGNFREDLYYRLNVVNIHIPPLRERTDDIPLMASAFLKEFAEENGKSIEGIDNKAAMALYNYSWPGNVRELRNCMESAVVLSKGHFIMPEDLPPSVVEGSEDGYIKIKLGSNMAESEKAIIRSTLNYVNGNKSRAAEILGIGRKTLHRKIHDFGLEQEFLKSAQQESNDG